MKQFSPVFNLMMILFIPFMSFIWLVMICALFSLFGATTMHECVIHGAFWFAYVILTIIFYVIFGIYEEAHRKSKK